MPACGIRAPDDVPRGQVEGTNLWQAAAYGHVELIDLQAAQGADLNALNQDGWAPLHLAVVVGQIKAAEKLLSKGAKVNTETAGGRSALDIALTPGFSEDSTQQQTREKIAALLRNHGAKPGSKCCGSGN